MQVDYDATLADSNSIEQAQRPPRRVLRPLAILVALALVVAFFATRRTSPSSKPLTRAEVDKATKAAIDKALADAKAAPPDAAAAYQTILPSLVLIRAATRKFAQDPSGIATGVIVNDQGDILTALHVVKDATSITVTYADGTSASATIDTSDDARDIASLKPDGGPTAIVAATLGGGARIGDPVFAAGHPIGLANSISAGVVSGLDRSVPVKNGPTLTGLIQFDAPINPGNAGGPLLNRNGQVIGIITDLPNPTEQTYSVGIGFAVPIEAAAGAAGGPPK